MESEKATSSADDSRKTQLRSVITRQKLLDAAVEAFSQLGFEGTSTRDIAKRAGVHHPLITYHFTNKNELWRAATDQLFGEFNAALAKTGEAVAGQDPKARAAALLRTYVMYSSAQPGLHRIILQEAHCPSDRLDWMVERHLRPLFIYGREALVQLQEIGVAPDGSPAMLFNMIRVCAGGLIALKLEALHTTGIDLDDDDQVEELVEMIVRVFFPGTARGN